MALKVAMWAHGTIVEPEYPITFVERKGWGLRLGGKNQFDWFHIPIPTLVILDDIRPLLGKISIFYNANRSTIKNIHLWDGARQVKRLDNLNLSGDHSGGIDASNGWVIDPPAPIAFGLEISVGVQFGIDSGDILFNTASRFQKAIVQRYYETFILESQRHYYAT